MAHTETNLWGLLRYRERSNELGTGAKAATDLCSVVSTEVTAALELILQGYTNLGCGSFPDLMEVGAFAEGEEPDECADDYDSEGVNEESIVENDKAEGDMAFLYEGDYGYDKCH